MTGPQAANEPQKAEVADEDSSPDTEPSLTVDQQVSHYIDLWKHSVSVQMHFNDIEWRIRGLALTVATFALGAAAVASREDARVGYLSLGLLVILAGLVLWYAFYFVDRYWYHPLLKGAVESGTAIEREIKRFLPCAQMTATITQRSIQVTTRPMRFLIRKKTLHSDDKLELFYRVGALALALTGIVMQVGSMSLFHS